MRGQPVGLVPARLGEPLLALLDEEQLDGRGRHPALVPGGRLERRELVRPQPPEERAGEGEQLRPAAEVAGELDHHPAAAPRLGDVPAEDLDLRVAEAVDGLALVADREELAGDVRAEQVDHLLLEAVGVLELVDQDVAVAPRERRGHAGLVAQERAGQALHVLVVDQAPPGFVSGELPEGRGGHGVERAAMTLAFELGPPGRLREIGQPREGRAELGEARLALRRELEQPGGVLVERLQRGRFAAPGLEPGEALPGGGELLCGLAGELLFEEAAQGSGRAPGHVRPAAVELGPAPGALTRQVGGERRQAFRAVAQRLLLADEVEHRAAHEVLAVARHQLEETGVLLPEVRGEGRVQEAPGLHLGGHAELRVDPGQEEVLAKQRSAEAVDGGDLGALGRAPLGLEPPRAELGHHPLAHLRGGAHREGDGEYFAGRHPVLGHEREVPADEQAGLARPGAGVERQIPGALAHGEIAERVLAGVLRGRGGGRGGDGLVRAAAAGLLRGHRRAIIARRRRRAGTFRSRRRSGAFSDPTDRSDRTDPSDHAPDRGFTSGHTSPPPARSPPRPPRSAPRIPASAPPPHGLRR